MKYINLTQNLCALVDDEDFERLNQFKWQAVRRGKTFYAARRDYRTGKFIYMHREILNAKERNHVHHLNECGLDNRRSNIVEISPSDHMRHRGLRSDSSTGFCCVWKLPNGRFGGQVRIGKTRIWIGAHDTAEEAALARDRIARSLGWPECGLNFPGKIAAIS